MTFIKRRYATFRWHLNRELDQELLNGWTR
jgi:hypothetical protein